MQIKICGITRPEDGRAAVAAGAHAIGLVFYPQSRRAVTASQALEICAALPPLAMVVGLFVNAEPETVAQIVAEVPLSLLQFHGHESADYCRQFGRPWIKALPAVPGEPLEQQMSAYLGARGILLDSPAAGQFGGTGETFDWSILPERPALPLVLAGGLTPNNVAAAVRTVKPAAVDVSSGVESAPGIKDAEKMRRFVANATQAVQEMAE